MYIPECILYRDGLHTDITPHLHKSYLFQFERIGFHLESAAKGTSTQGQTTLRFD